MEDESAITELVEEILVSGRTPEEVCAECPENLEEVRLRLGRIRMISEQLDDLFPSTALGLSEVQRMSVESEVRRLPQIPGYEVKSVEGRGGVGVVYRARHLLLDRTVALKMLLSGEFAGAAERKRFQREALAVARLSHPHVVQIHDLGEWEGRPYFTMEFVEGGTLAHKLDGAPLPAAKAAAMIGTLAEAMQAAHEAGIVHRDLKPSNILLTPEGVPKISDFGLARHFGGEGTMSNSEVHIGTPSYMAPEQATGKASDIGPGADIYALGAILYEMLTGRPPFRGESPTETIRQLLNEEPVGPSRLNARVPRDLETICVQCLRKDPKRRYGSAAALAEDIGRFERSEPISARRAGIVERAGKWARRRPALAAMIAATILMIAAGIGIGLRLAAYRAGTVRAVSEDLQEAEDSESGSDWISAASALDRAHARMQNHAVASLDERWDGDERDLEFGQLLESIGLNRTAWVESQFARLFDNAHADAAYLAAFQQHGIGSAGDDPAAVAGRIRTSNDRSSLIAALDDWALCATEGDRRQWIFEVASKADPDSTGWRNRVRNPSVSRGELVELAETDAAIKEPVRLLAALGERLEDAGASGEAMAFLRRVQWTYPGDFWANFMLADALRKSGNCAESVRYYQAAIALRPRSTVAIGNLGMALAADNQLTEAEQQFRQEITLDPDSGHAHYCLGLMLRKMGRVGEAVEQLAESTRLEPDDANHQYNLALALVDKGELDGAIEHFESALTIDPNDSDSRYNLGLVLMTQGKNEKAIEQFRDVLKTDPDNSQAHYCLGLALKSAGNLNESIEQLERASKLDPSNAAAFYNLGLAFMQAGKMDPAVAEFQAAQKIDPNEADDHYILGVALMNEGKNDAALEQFQETLKLLPQKAQAHYLIGLLLKGEGRFELAVQHLQKASELEPGDPYVRYNLGLALVAVGKAPQAVSEFESSLKIDPNQPDAHFNLALVLMKQGKSDLAIGQFEEAVRLDPNNFSAQYNLGLLLKGSGAMGEAIEHLQKATELNPADPYAHYNLGLGLLAAKQNEEAVEQFRASLKINPNQPDVHYNLAIGLMTMGRLYNATDHFRQAIALNPSFGYAYGGLGESLMGETRLTEASEALEHCLEVLPAGDPWRQQYVDVLQQCREQISKRGEEEKTTRPDSAD